MLEGLTADTTGATGTSGATADTTMAAGTTAAPAETAAAAAGCANHRRQRNRAGGGLEGRLNFLNFTGWIGKGERASFAKANPKAKVNEAPWQSSDDAIAKAKGRSGDIDVLLVDGTTFPSLAALDVLAEFGSSVPNFANIDAEFTGRPWDPTNTRFAAPDDGRPLPRIGRTSSRSGRSSTPTSTRPTTPTSSTRSTPAVS